ncbi:MAG: ribulokinase [Oscillospiraceae bacterium]|nr:ribulokinase [Oscillospiraceae bacterium]
MAKYVIGIDFGTLSVRALIVNVKDGSELAAAVYDYPHAVMAESLPNGHALPPDWALQHPQDYLDGLSKVVRQAVADSGINAEDVIGIGIDFTTNTYLPVDERYEPLCLKPEWQDNPHAWVKLWKHHGTQNYAEQMEKKAIERGEKFLKRYGGKVSPAWMFPRLLETLVEAPDLYDATAKFIEAGDWIVSQLTGQEKRSLGMAGYKAFWSKKDGYPSDTYLKSLNPKFEHVIDEKLSRDIYPLGTKAGELNARGAAMTGLPEGVAVAVANMDAHVSLPAVGLTDSGNLLIILGTSACHIMLGAVEKEVPGVGGIVEDGVIPGTYGYESGQNCVGDSLKWFVDNCFPAAYAEAAKKAGLDENRYLTSLAEQLKPGQSGLLALDWWNGNRSILCDYDLTGMILGLTIASKPEEIYRALIEATAYGTRRIVESFEESGLPVDRVFACGGIAKKNAMFMQIYSDVLNRDIRIARSSQTPALGSAIFGAVAAGAGAGGYDSIETAAHAMGGTSDTVYHPIPENVRIYNELYSEYLILHDYFGRGENNVMKRLRKYRD